jgi:colanic acid/amylovoran biosynthesis glycosyltransferase
VASYCTFFLKLEMQHIYRQVTSLRRADTFVITKHRQNPDRYSFPDIEQQPRPRRDPLTRAYLKYIRRQPALRYRGELEVLLEILQRRQPDLLHIYFGNTGVHLLPLIELWSGVSIVSFHGMDVQERPEERGYATKLRQLLQVIPMVLVRSHSIGKKLIELGCPPEKIRLNRTGVPLDQFPWRCRVFPADGEWRLVQACRLVPKKGLLTALRAFARFRERYPRAKFSIAGEGPMRKEVEKAMVELGLDQAVELTGFLTPAALADLYASAHLFVHPSEVPPDANQEGVPNSLLEAMATGLPVAATYHGGIPEAVTDGVNGRLVAERDDQALADALFELSGDPVRYAEMSKAAADSVVENFDQQKSVAQLEAIYFEALDLAPRSGARP